MKKLGLMLFIPLLMCSILFGKETSTGTNTKSSADVSELETASLQQSKEMLRWNSVLDKLAVGDERVLKAEAEKIGPDRETSVIRRKLQRTRETKTGIDAYLNRKWAGPRSDELGLSLAKTLPTTLNGVGTIPAKFVNATGDSIGSYTVGDTIGIVITYDDSVWIDIYVDDGDGMFDLEDFTFEPGDGDEEIVIIDGDSEDEDTTAGVWKTTFDTGDVMEGGEIFGLQGARLFFELSDPAANTGLVTIDVLPPATTTSISGIVQMENLTPAPNMMVTAFPMTMMMEETDGPPKGMAITMTDTSGAYTLAIPDDDAGQDYMIFAMDVWYLYSGLFPDPFMHQTYVGLGDNPYGLDFTLKTGTVTFSGTITDEDGSGIEGLHLYFNTGPYDVETVTGTVGDYSVTLIGGHWNAWVDEGDLESMGYMISHGEDFEVVDGEVYTGNDLVLYSADTPISGTVTWSGGTPAEDIEVQAGTQDHYARTRTGPDGSYTLMVSFTLDSMEVTDDWGTWTNIGYWVSAWGEDALCQPGGYDGVRAGETGIDFTMYAADAVLSGHVYDEETGDPMRDIELEAFTIEDTLWFQSNARTDGSGYFEMNLVGGLTYQVDLHRPDMWWPPALSDTIYVTPGSNPVRDYYLPAPREHVAVEGYVYDMDGHSVAKARVELIQTDGPFYADIVADGGGYFRVEGVPAFGEFDMIASAPGFPPQHQHIWTNGGDVWVEFWLGGTARIRVSGQITDESDLPISEALVLVYAPDVTEPVGSAFTWEDGNYELFLKPGLHTIKAGATGFLVNSVAVDLPPEVPDTTFDFTLASAEGELTASISGRVTDEGGFGLSYVFVTYISDAYIAFTNTDYDGNYAFDLVTGDYLSLFHKEGYLEEFREWTVAGGEAHGVTMYPEAYLEITSVGDIGPDHGGKVEIIWDVNSVIHGNIKEFAIWQLGLPGNPDANILTLVDAHLPAHYRPAAYRRIVETEVDVAPHTYVVMAYGFDDYPLWDSNSMEGASFDELRPEIPPSTVAIVAGVTELDVVLTWQPAIDDPATDKPVASYIIHRGGETGDPVPVADGIEATEYTETLAAYGTYRYAVSAVDFAGNESVLSEVVTHAVLSVADGMGIPEVYALGANYPNPFNPSTTITYQLPEAGRVTLQVFDLTGKVVSTLVSDYRPVGYHRVVWDGRDSRGAPAATGVYFYRIAAGEGYAKTRKMVLMK